MFEMLAAKSSVILSNLGLQGAQLRLRNIAQNFSNVSCPCRAATAARGVQMQKHLSHFLEITDC